MFDQQIIHPVTLSVTDRVYSRAIRRTGSFVVIVDNEFIILKSPKPLIFDSTDEIKKASIFTWKNAERVADKFIQNNPKIKMIVRNSKTKLLQIQ